MRRIFALVVAAALAAGPAAALELNTPPGSGGGGGGVSSVGLSLPGAFSCTGSPIVSSGTITCSFTSETANTVFAAPSGTSGAPGFRALGLPDLPAIANNTIYGNISGASAAPAALTASQVATLLGLGSAASKTASGAGATVASVAGSFTTGHCLQSADANGTVEDAGAACGGGGGGATIVISGTGITVSSSPCTTNCTVALDPPGPSTIGGIESIAAVAHQWINAISTGGVPGATQPACGDLSDAAASCATDATNAANLSAGTLSDARLAADVALTGQANTFTKRQAVTPVALTDGATITPDFSASNNFTVTLGGNRTLANPSNIVAGACGFLAVTQDGTGARTLTWGSDWKWAGGTAPTLTTTAAATDLITYCTVTSSMIVAELAVAAAQ